MNLRYFVLTVFLSVFVSCAAFGDRVLDRGEILGILEHLTSEPQKGWISAGTIEAGHEEYRAAEITSEAEIDSRITQEINQYQSNPNKRELTSELQQMKLEAIGFNVRYRLSNNYTMYSNVVVRCDGDRFYWEINVSSRSDSVFPGASLEGNFMTEEFNLDYNKVRIFSWDGQKYTIYFKSGGHSVVDTTGSLPRAVTGPLTAGHIPWGYGDYTYANLSAASSAAEEKNVNGQPQVHMTINRADGSEMVFVLDPGKDYALISSSISDGGEVVSAEYGNYQLVSGKWVPLGISIERHDAWTNRLLSYDIWSFTSISGTAPGPGSFSAAYDADALIEYRSNLTSKPAMYSYSYDIDTGRLLLERLAYAASEGVQVQNCATAALKYAMTRSGKDVPDRALAGLVSEQDKGTSLYRMKEFAEGRGLYCRAVKLDVDGLKKLKGCEAILHIPDKKHYIVLAGIDDRRVGRIDLTANKFYHRTSVNYLDTEWTEGTALLISSRPITIEGNFSEISDARLRNISGGNGWQCIELLQEEDEVYCGWNCTGYYEYYPERWGCEYVGSGYCAHSAYLRKSETECIIDPYYGDCTISGEWTDYYMWACE
jgi:hypothetical protein